MSRILIVDDDETYRTTLQALLEDFGHECRVVKNGAEALIELEIGSFDLVIMDFDMPVIGGLNLLNVMAERGFLPTIPVIIISSHISPIPENLIKKAGAFALMLKPYDVEKLFALVSEALQSRIKENPPENNKKA